MAVKLTDEFGSRANPSSSAYPNGSLKDETNPGVSNDGSPLSSRVGNDFQGFMQSALAEAGIDANGNPDSVDNPQILNALKKVQENHASTYTDLVFDNVELAKANDIVLGQTIACTRYHDNGDLVDGLKYKVTNQNPSHLGTINHQAANGLYLELIHSNSIKIEQAGGIGDCDVLLRTGTDNSSAIEACDAFAVEKGIGFVDFLNKPYLSEKATPLLKSPFTTWRAPRGSVVGSSNTLESRQMAGSVYSKNDDACVRIVNPQLGSNLFCGYVTQFDGLDLVGDYPNYPNATGYIVDPLIKQLAFEQHWVRGYKQANDLKFNGEFFYNLCNYQFNKYAFKCENSADFWINDSHLGSGKSVLGSDFSGGLGVNAFASGNFIFSNSRPQVQDSGSGGFFNLCSNITFGESTIDQNEINGLVFQNCRGTNINGSRFFDNGKEGGNSGVQLASYRQVVTPNSADNTFTHSTSFSGRFIKTKIGSEGTLPTGLNSDDYYWTRYLSFNTTAIYTSFQDARDDINRVEFSDNGSGAFYFVLGCQDTTISATNFTDRGKGYQLSGVKHIGDNFSELVRTNLNGNDWSSMLNGFELASGVVGEEFRRSNNTGDTETVLLSPMASNYSLDPYKGESLIVISGSITSARDIIVSENGVWRGWQCRISRNTTSQGDANIVTVKTTSGATIGTIANGESKIVTFAGGNLILA